MEDVEAPGRTAGERQAGFVAMPGTGAEVKGPLDPRAPPPAELVPSPSRQPVGGK